MARTPYLLRVRPGTAETSAAAARSNYPSGLPMVLVPSLPLWTRPTCYTRRRSTRGIGCWAGDGGHRAAARAKGPGGCHCPWGGQADREGGRSSERPVGSGMRGVEWAWDRREALGKAAEEGPCQRSCSGASRLLYSSESAVRTPPGNLRPSGHMVAVQALPGGWAARSPSSVSFDVSTVSPSRARRRRGQSSPGSQRPSGVPESYPS